MPLTGASVERRQGLGNRQPLETGVSALVTTGVAVAGGLQLNTVYTLYSLQDALTLGITPEYDTTNKVLLHEELRRYFLRTDAELWLLVADQEVSMTTLADPDQNYAKRLLAEAGGRVRGLALSRHPVASPAAATVSWNIPDGLADGYELVLTNGLDGSSQTYKFGDSTPSVSGSGSADADVLQAFLNATGDVTDIWQVELVDQTLTFTHQVTGPEGNASSLVLLDETAQELLNLTFSGGASGYTPASTANGLDEDVFMAIPQLKELRDQEENSGRPVNFWLPGRHYTGSASDLKDLRTLGADTLDAYNISVCLASDPTVLARDAAYAGWADVATALGQEAAVEISAHIGEVIPENDVANAAEAVYQQVALSDGKALSNFDDDNPTLTALDNKGYVFLRRYNNVAGVYFEKDHTAQAPGSVDYGDYENRRFCRIYNESYRIVYPALVRMIKRRVALTSDGSISELDLARFNEEAYQPLLQLVEQGHLTRIVPTTAANFQLVEGFRQVTIGLEMQPVFTTELIRTTITLRQQL